MRIISYLVCVIALLTSSLSTYAAHNNNIDLTQDRAELYHDNDEPTAYEVTIVEETDELLDWIDSVETIDELPADATDDEIVMNTMILDYKGTETIYPANLRRRKRTCSAVNSSGKKGVASWYGPGFHGNKTANGERFNRNKLTAAHKTLPFNSIVEVSYKGKTVRVRINDDGPHTGGRIIDLSESAAKSLGMKNAGTGQVTIRLVSCGGKKA